jgi:hypothetical protein
MGGPIGAHPTEAAIIPIETKADIVLTISALRLAIPNFMGIRIRQAFCYSPQGPTPDNRGRIAHVFNVWTPSRTWPFAASAILPNGDTHMS